MSNKAQTFFTALGIITGILLLLSLLQTYKLPSWIFTESLDIFMTKITLGLFALFLVYFILLPMFFHIREGFEDSSKPLDSWNTIIKDMQLQELCILINDVQAKMTLLEKGAPPDQLTDDQAREHVKAEFDKNIPSGPFSCVAFNKLQADSDLDTFYTNIQLVPDSFLLQAYETAVYCEKQYQSQLEHIQGSLDMKNAPKVDLPLESFVDICSPEVVIERRKLIRGKQLSDAAKVCLLPEEVPAATKEQEIATKLRKLQEAYGTPKRPIREIIQSCKDIATQLDDYSKKAQSGSLISDITS